LSCRKVTGADLFNGDLFWDTGSVKTMESMFHSAMSFTGRGLMNWKTSSVATVKSMFAEAGSFNADISAWDVGNVKDMTEAFFFASNFNSNLNLWNVSKVESLNSTFHGASSFNRDLSLWDVQNTVSFEGMVRFLALWVDAHVATLSHAGLLGAKVYRGERLQPKPMCMGSAAQYIDRSRLERHVCCLGLPQHG
jgi:surface protein